MKIIMITIFGIGIMGLYMGEDRSDFCEDNHDKNIITIIQGGRDYGIMPGRT